MTKYGFQDSATENTQRKAKELVLWIVHFTEVACRCSGCHRLGTVIIVLVTKSDIVSIITVEIVTVLFVIVNIYYGYFSCYSYHRLSYDQKLLLSQLLFVTVTILLQLLFLLFLSKLLLSELLLVTICYSYYLLQLLFLLLL